MADLAASNVTVAIEYKSNVPRLRLSLVTLSFGDGALTYPAGGIPLPTPFSKYGMVTSILRMICDFDNAYVYQYDAANHKLLVYYGDYSNAADGVLVQATGVALAAAVVNATIFGR
jgi:hypothetical protein